MLPPCRDDSASQEILNQVQGDDSSLIDEVLSAYSQFL